MMVDLISDRAKYNEHVVSVMTLGDINLDCSQDVSTLTEQFLFYKMYVF